MKDVIVVGSGAGGATVARELSKKGVNVTLIEKGPFIKPKKAYEHYENSDVGVELLKTACVGGTTMVTAGNAVRTCQKRLKKFGINLEEEFREAELEMGVGTLPDSHFGAGTQRIMAAAESLGIPVKKMPKSINPTLCKPCGKCAFGCPKDAKWTSLEYVEDAKKSCARVVENTEVTELIIEDGEVKGVRSREKEFYADEVVLAPGAVETPRLLRRAGLDAGNNFFVDTFVTVGGIMKGVEFNKEVQMNALIKKSEDIILAPHFSEILVDKLSSQGARTRDIIGLMVKIKDEASGRIRENSIVKYSTANDVALLSEGSALAGSILTEVGVDPNTLKSTHARGAHPGGTAAVGSVVDKNLETEISGLFVADASVLPEAPGAPPVLTIVALAKRLGKYLGEN